jgi:predicted class III extradiol MEMO1 family dioxygenase
MFGINVKPVCHNESKTTLRVFDSSVIRQVSETNRDNLDRRLVKERHDLCSAPGISSVIKSWNI